MEDHQQKRRSRRAFLRTAGSAAGVLLAPSVLAACATTAATTPLPPSPQALRIGVLLPRNARHTGLATQLYDGMRLALGTQNGSTSSRFVLLPAEYTSPSDSLVQAQHLVNTGQVDLITGLISRNHAATLDSLLRERGVPAVVSNIGANVIDQNHQRGPFIRNSLNYWQSNLALGQWAARERGQQAVIITSLYEAGYDALYAFRYGFEQAGGEIRATHVVASPGDLNATVALLAEQRPELVYAAFSGQEAVTFMRTYAESPACVHAAGGTGRHTPARPGDRANHDYQRPQCGHSQSGRHAGRRFILGRSVYQPA